MTADDPCPPHCCCCGPGEPCCDCGEIMPSLEVMAGRILNRLTPAQKRMIAASEPDDITGEEGCGVEISGSSYRVAKALEAMGLGTYSHGSPFGDLYFNNGEGLAVRLHVIEEAA